MNNLLENITLSDMSLVLTHLSGSPSNGIYLTHTGLRHSDILVYWQLGTTHLD